jgi:hypothetical protein
MTFFKKLEKALFKRSRGMRKLISPLPVAYAEMKHLGRVIESSGASETS